MTRFLLPVFAAAALALSGPGAAQDMKAKKDTRASKAAKKAAKKATDPEQNWGRFNKDSQREIKQLEKQKAAKK